jgi:hypothetical protein
MMMSYQLNSKNFDCTQMSLVVVRGAEHGLHCLEHETGTDLVTGHRPSGNPQVEDMSVPLYLHLNARGSAAAPFRKASRKVQKRSVT